MDERQFQRYMRWRFRHMSRWQSLLYMIRMYWALVRGKFSQFVREDARGIDKWSAMSDNEVQRRATK